MGAFSKAVKTPRGHARSGFDNFLVIQEGNTHSFHDQRGWRPAPWLPVQTQEQRISDEYYTLLAGQIGAISTAGRDVDGNTSTPKLVPCNGGSATTITYGADDVGYTDNIDTSGTTHDAVESAGAASATLAANYPVGWIRQHLFGSQIQLLRVNYQLNYPIVELIIDEIVQIGLENSAQDTLAAGRYVKASSTAAILGRAVLFDPSSDAVDQVAGRVLEVFTIESGTSSPGRLDLVKPVGGLSLPGVDTSGKPKHLDTTRTGTTTAITQAAFIRAFVG
jgi:hypothetical protein